ncbi:MAG: hypothetical protein LKK00_01665 [Intestinimonas sp.]|nr:hypothetical protein [Intestinimonas sp.]
MAINPYRYLTYEGEECVEFETVGKNKFKVIVDKKCWDEYLSNYSWTAIISKSRVNVKTSINKQSQRIWRLIIEHEKEEIDYWGSTIDHENNNPLDNRLSNLRIFNTSLLNTTNVSSKYKKSDMQYIHKQGRPKIVGYKVHYNLGGKTFYKNFSIRDYGSEEAALSAAKQYRDNVVLKSREKTINDLVKKCRDVEFERGLKNKIQASEIDEIIKILKKYGFIANHYSG